jgi:hypothetical protein
VSERRCGFCDGTTSVHTVYNRSGGGGIFSARCPRCGGSGREPSAPCIHPSLLLRNVRSGKVWAVYSVYNGAQAAPPTDHERAWGIHRMIPDRVCAGHYVWQIRVLGEDVLLNTRRWVPIGFGDAWDHDAMEATPLAARPSRGGGE